MTMREKWAFFFNFSLFASAVSQVVSGIWISSPTLVAVVYDDVSVVAVWTGGFGFA